jgi:hypothetical protein
MPSFRFIPKRLFQIIALILLLVCFGLAIYFIATASGVFRWLQTMIGEDRRGMAMVLTFLILFVGWVIVVLPLRIMSHMPTLDEEMEAAGAENISEFMRKSWVKYDVNKMPLRKRQRFLGWGGLAFGLFSTAVAVVLFLVLESEVIPVGAIVLALVGFGGGLLYLVRSMFTKDE